MPLSGPATGRAAIVVHGSSGSSGGTIHALSSALAARGVETWAVDIRGHGASGTRGDIGYVGQLEDDLADLVGMIRKTAPVSAADAGRPFLRRRFCAARGGLADPGPVRAHRAARALSRLTMRPPPGRIPAAGRKPIFRASLACSRCAPSASPAARRCRCWRSRCRRIPRRTLVGTYSDRLMRNFAVRDRDFRRDLAAARSRSRSSPAPMTN